MSPKVIGVGRAWQLQRGTAGCLVLTCEFGLLWYGTGSRACLLQLPQMQGHSKEIENTFTWFFLGLEFSIWLQQGVDKVHGKYFIPRWRLPLCPASVPTASQPCSHEFGAQIKEQTEQERAQQPVPAPRRGDPAPCPIPAPPIPCGSLRLPYKG